jgi:beta-glucosidase
VGETVKSSRRSLRIATLALLVLGLTFALVSASTSPSISERASAASSSSCPWVAASLNHSTSAATLAREVVARMTLSEKANLVVLKVVNPVENTTVAIPRLCIPAFTLTDGPVGVASGQHGVTQFPSSIAVASTFDPALARLIGVAMGQETRAKGYDVLQGPNLNLTRVPYSGRIFETYGEDPALASAMGVATIDGVQSTGVMAEAKHFTGYTQETARGRINQVISTRALAELYNLPFKAAVTQAHVASIMCAMGSLNGVNTCSSPYVYSTLKAWGFAGFTRTDYRAVSSAAAAFAAGVSLIKPSTAASIIRLVEKHQLPTGALNSAVTAVLTQMFIYGLIAHPRTLDLARTVTDAAHAQLALRAAESSAVLLKNQTSMLPLASSVPSIAVIGSDAQTAPITAGGGSSTVKPPYVITPLQAVRSTFGTRAKIAYVPGGPATLELDQLQFSDLLSGKPLPKPIPISTVGEPGKADLNLDFAHTVTAAVATATTVMKGDGWSRWQAVLRPPRTGTYEFALQQVGDTWFSVNGKTLIGSPGIHGAMSWAATLPLVAGHRYTLTVRWFSVTKKVVPKLGVADVTSQIVAAVKAAKKASVAVIFAGSFSTEGVDQPSLSLPGDANALISAVAAANPRTVVVLNTSGAVYMPWLNSVRAVIEAWYPGQMDGAAVAAILSGKVNPSGHLPITFPSRTTAQPIAIGQAFPGVKSVVHFGSGLDLGYRWFQLNNVRPLFPFGFGMSYTTFALSNATISKAGGGVVVHVDVTNTGKRSGADAVQAYVSYPSSAGEPPYQLRAFSQVGLAPHQTRSVTLTIPRSGFQIYGPKGFTTLAGTYGVALGPSSAHRPIRLSVQLN